MNLSYFIAKRIGEKQPEGFSSTVHKIAVASIAIGLAALIISFLIMSGFQQTVKTKIYDFSGHLFVLKYSDNNSLEETPLDFNIDLYNHFSKIPYIDHVQEFAHKAGLIKTGDEVLGVFVKGIGRSFDQEAFSVNMVEGNFIAFPEETYSKDIVLSKIIANKLQVGVGDEIIIHFFQDPPRARKLSVTGIYESNLSEYFDSNMVIGDLRLIQRLNGWADSIAGGIEIFVSDVNRVEEVRNEIVNAIDYDLFVGRVSDKYSQVFEWLNLVSRQVTILLVIILFVVCVNMISIVLILVMERTQMIGMLKALGGENKFIRSIFIYRGVNLILRGLVYGNIIGLGLCFMQYKFHLITLNPRDYYMSVVPISWDWNVILFLNVLTFLVVTVILFIPTIITSRLNPMKAIRFD